MARAKETNRLTLAQRETLVTEALPYFHAVARGLSSALGCPQESDDLIAVGWMELWKFSARWDSKRNEHFQKAAYVRVRGAMIDYLRYLPDRNRRGRIVTLLPLEPWDVDLPYFTVSPPADGFLCDWRKGLTRKMVIVLEARYGEDATFKEITKLTGCNEARGCQLHAAGLKRLRTKVHATS